MEFFVYVMITAIIAGAAAYHISITMGKGGVFGSALVILIAAVFLQNNPILGSLGVRLTVMATTASYAGMVAAKNVANQKEMMIVSILTGLMLYAAEWAALPAAEPIAFYNAVGGRLGVVAALAVLCWMGIKKVFLKKEIFA